MAGKNLVPDGFPQAPRVGGGGMNRFGPKPKPKDVKRTLGKLFAIYIKEKRSLLAITALLLCSSAVLLIAPRLVGVAVNTIDAINAAAPDYSYVNTVVIILLCCYVTDWLCSTLQGWWMAGVSQRIVRQIRFDLFDKLQRLPLTYHDTHHHGELMSRVTNDIDNISGTIAASTSQLISSVVTIAGSLVLMLFLSPLLTPAALITAPLIILLTKGIASRSRQMFVRQQQELGALGAIIEESVWGLRMVKAFNKEKDIIEGFKKTNEALRYHSIQAQIWAGFLMPMMNVITNLGYGLVAGVGGILAVQGHISVGIIASFVTYTRLFVRPLNDIASTFNQLQSALAGAERVFNVMSQQEEEADASDAVEMKNPRGDVRFTEVSFGYTPTTEVLHGVSFHVKAGETVALVGKTGAGKTTIVNLLTRFYDAGGGRIEIDGRDIRGYKRQSLMKAFTVVLQDTCLFTGTIADNIRYGRPGAADKEIVEAAKAANADAFIRRLPHGYNTMVSGAVDSLSQGQRQLIAIARAVLCSAPILILDEATSSVDTSTELKIQEALLRFRKGRTSFVIAHRLSTIRDADCIFVVDGGRIIESGNHGELMARAGTYAGMVNSMSDSAE